MPVSLFWLVYKERAEGEASSPFLPSCARVVEISLRPEKRKRKGKKKNRLRRSMPNIPLELALVIRLRAKKKVAIVLLPASRKILFPV